MNTLGRCHNLALNYLISIFSINMLVGHVKGNDLILDKQFFKIINVKTSWKDMQYCEPQRRKYEAISNIFIEESRSLMHCAK